MWMLEASLRRGKGHLEKPQRLPAIESLAEMGEL